MKHLFYDGLERPRTAYLRAIHKHLGESTRVLDIGCGYTAPDLQGLNRHQGRRVGVDVVPFRGETPEGIELIQADCCDMPIEDESFELVISRSVLEHLDEPSQAFREIARVLVPGGRFVFLTPNRWDYVSISASLIPNSWHPRLVRTLTGRSEDDTFPTRYRANSTRQIHRLAKANGMDCESVHLLREHPHYLQFSSIAYALGLAYEQTVQRNVSQLRPWIIGVLCKAG